MGFKYRKKLKSTQNYPKKKVKFLGDEESEVEKANLSLKEVWKKYVEINGLGVRGFVIEEYIIFIIF